MPDDGPRFENLIGAHLLEWVQYLLDTEGRELGLRHYRYVAGREVDFVVVERRAPVLLVEVKLSAEPASPSLRYLKARFPDADAYQVHLRGARESVTPDGIRLWGAARFLRRLI